MDYPLQLEMIAVTGRYIFTEICGNSLNVERSGRSFEVCWKYGESAFGNASEGW